MEQDFIAPRLASRNKARETGRYISADTMLLELRAKLDSFKKKSS